MQPTETAWLGAYEAWSDDLGASLAAGRPVSRAMCESRFDDEVGDPPKERLEPASAAARSGCEALTPTGWRRAEADVVRALVVAHGEVLPPRRRPALSEIAGSSVGVRPEVFCWAPAAWASFSEHHALVRGGEEISLKGIADIARDRIDLDPGVCSVLARYLRGIRPSALSYENFELAEAITVLTHQAEHLKAPSLPETEVECYAVQHVRPLVDDVWGPSFANEIALHAWEISYTQLPPRFRTPECRNGGRLDRSSGSNAWP